MYNNRHDQKNHLIRIDSFIDHGPHVKSDPLKLQKIKQVSKTTKMHVKTN